MKKDNQTYWHNFRTSKDEYIETPTDFSDYVPQIGGLGLYKLYIERDGMTPAEAARKVLRIASGEEK